MEGTVSHELEVSSPAGEVWAIYGTLRLGKLAIELVPGVIEKVEVVEGDGGEGTVLSVTMSSGFPEPRTYKEKFVKVDNEKRVKEVEVVEGGFLNLGFCLYRVGFEIIEKDGDSSIIRSSIDYAIGEEDSKANASLVTAGPLAALAEAIANYLTEKKV